MSNPTNHGCPSDISQLDQTNFTPNKTVYANVLNNNSFREFLQKNSNAIRLQNQQNHARSMNCMPEKNNYHRYIVPFNSTHLDHIEKKTVPQYILPKVKNLDTIRKQNTQF